MRYVILITAALAIAAVAFAEPYEEKVKFDEEEAWTSLKIEFDDVNATAYLSEIYTGQVKKAVVRFANDENLSTKYDTFKVTTIEGASKEMSSAEHIVGIFQFTKIYPATDTCEFELSFEVSKGLKERIAYGFVKPENFVPVGGEVKNMGSLVSTKDAEDPGYVDYMDQTDIGWSVSYDKDAGIVTVKGTSEAYMDFDSGCFDAGAVIVK
ncbi:MAG: hypothetical protein JSW52_07180 [Candidatus Coatesbacteria bacterium]|nr:MAG: hypothetical protein JSW52_07180 [Candidatus Coatesbacteria bacterium]